VSLDSSLQFGPLWTFRRRALLLSQLDVGLLVGQDDFCCQLVAEGRSEGFGVELLVVSLCLLFTSLVNSVAAGLLPLPAFGATARRTAVVVATVTQRPYSTTAMVW